MNTAAVQSKPRALVHPYLDIWLLGGLSYLALLAVWLATDVAGVELKHDIPWWAFYAAFVVNYPHFAYSYQLFYRGFVGRLFGEETELLSRLRLVMAGIIVPALMIGYFVHVGMIKDRDMMGYGVSAMFFFVGWHYVKQGYGVLITASIYKGIFYKNWQKYILVVNAYAVWVYAWMRGNAAIYKRDYYDIKYMAIDMPENAIFIAGTVAVVTTLLAVIALVYSWRHSRSLSYGGVLGYTSSSYFWVLFASVHPLFFYMVPFFHSLQYLAFVYKFKKSEFTQTRDQGAPLPRHALKLLAFILAGFVLGGVMMDWLPKWFDSQVAVENVGFTRNYYLVSFLLFINIHHFFIDNAFWRRDNKEVQTFLFRS
jgi:hypothetical protein